MKNNENRYTKTNKLADIEKILNTVDSTEYDIPALIEFVQGEQAALARKAEKARETAAAKKTEIDELGEAVLAVLTAEPQTRDQIADQVDVAESTIAKVGARLTKLVAAGRAVKTEIASTSASGKKSTKMAYALATDAE